MVFRKTWGEKRDLQSVCSMILEVCTDQDEDALFVAPWTARFVERPPCLVGAHHVSRHECSPHASTWPHRRDERSLLHRRAHNGRVIQYDGFKCAYRHKRACAGYEEWAPLLLVHPVGIGLDSWFWHPFLRLWPGEAFAPDLIGCGRSDAWDPAERGLFIPLDWVRGLEALWRMHVRRPVILVSQGGLAPVALCLAARENDRRARDV